MFKPEALLEIVFRTIVLLVGGMLMPLDNRAYSVQLPTTSRMSIAQSQPDHPRHISRFFLSNEIQRSPQFSAW